MITDAQIRAAFAVLQWSDARAAKKTGLSVATVARLKKGGHDAKASTLAKITEVLSDNGIKMTDANGKNGLVWCCEAIEAIGSGQFIVGPRHYPAKDP